MLALAEHRASLCPCGCGHPRSVAWDQQTEGRVEVPPPTRCHVRTAIARAQAAWRQTPGAPGTDGLLWGAVVRPP